MIMMTGGYENDAKMSEGGSGGSGGLFVYIFGPHSRCVFSDFEGHVY